MPGAWLVALLPLLAAAALMGFLGEASIPTSSTGSLPRDADNTKAADLQEQLPRQDAATAVVLFTAAEGPDPLAPQQLEAVQIVVDRTQRELGLLAGPPVEPSEDATAALAVLSIPPDGERDVVRAVTDLRAALDDSVPDGVTARVTGPAAVEADLTAVFDGAESTLLLTTAGVVAVLLLLTYRSPVLWLVPLVVVGVADRLAAVLATHALGVLDMTWDESTVGILSVLVFGAGTDYALLLISRYRDELRREESRFVAMSHALSCTAEAVLSSAVTVVLGLLTLLLSLFPTTRSLGLACAIGIVVAAAYMLIVLPATLVLFGRWIFWPRIPRVGQPQSVESRTLWRRVGERVAARPVGFIAASTVFLGASMAGLFWLDTGLSGADQFLQKPEAIAAAERLAESFPAGSSDPVQVLTTGVPGQVVAAIEDVDGVVRADLSDSGGDITQIDAVIEAAPGSADSRAAVIAIRSAVGNLDGTSVGGTEAQALDAADAASRDRLLILPLIALLVLGALTVLLRSLVAPVLLVLTVVATYLASLGLSWWLFTGVFDFPALDVGVPLLAFLFLVALGVDYNIFLVSRASEEAAEHGARVGMLRALTATGGVITSAGVLLDTLLVRTLVVPALGVALGEWFWWPRHVGTAAVESGTEQPLVTM